MLLPLHIVSNLTIFRQLENYVGCFSLLSWVQTPEDSGYCSVTDSGNLAVPGLVLELTLAIFSYNLSAGGQYARDRVHQQQALSNSRAREVDRKVLQEQFLCTSGRWCMHFIIFF